MVGEHGGLFGELVGEVAGQRVDAARCRALRRGRVSDAVTASCTSAWRNSKRWRAPESAGGCATSRPDDCAAARHDSASPAAMASIAPITGPVMGRGDDGRGLEGALRGGGQAVDPGADHRGDRGRQPHLGAGGARW